MKQEKQTLEEIRKQERKMGNRIVFLIRKKLRTEIASSFKGGAKSLNDLRFKKKLGRVRLFGITLTMQKHGFVHNYGVDDKRTAHLRERTKPRNHVYTVKEHGYILKKTPFLDRAVDKSGAFEYFVEAVGKSRMAQMTVVLGNRKIKG